MPMNQELRTELGMVKKQKRMVVRLVRMRTK